jgi:hypothetical protein
VTFLPFVPLSEFTILRPLGYGRNGTVFLAEWQGQKVALKQFDTVKSKGAFESELQAYQAVRPAWGRLVPTPLFVSVSWSGITRFLALQLGRRPTANDDLSQWRKVFRRLEQEFRLRHNDDCDYERNMIFIPAPAPHGEEEIEEGEEELERLVAIDLEDVTILPLPQRKKRPKSVHTDDPAAVTPLET